MLSYPFSLSREDNNTGMSLKLISNQVLIERGYDIHTGTLIKCKMIMEGKTAANL